MCGKLNIMTFAIHVTHDLLCNVFKECQVVFNRGANCVMGLIEQKQNETTKSLLYTMCNLIDDFVNHKLRRLISLEILCSKINRILRFTQNELQSHFVTKHYTYSQVPL